MKAIDKKVKCIIRHKDFIFIPADHCVDRFDLYRATKNGKTGKDTKKLIGYGYRMEDALHKMIGVSLSERKDITDIKSYVDAYKKAVSELQNLIK